MKLANLFDSTGGILALGLGVMNWSVNRCMGLFLDLVERAFTPKFRVSLGSSKYRSRPLEEALRECFKDEAMFGGRQHIPAVRHRRVAVTSAKGTAEQAVVFTNYNRTADEKSKLELLNFDAN